MLAAPSFAQIPQKTKSNPAKSNAVKAAQTKNVSKATFSSRNNLLNDFQNPPQSAKPWVIWYWMHAAVSKEGITADLEAMKQAGIGGAYLMPIRGVTNPPLFTPVAEQLTPEWWEMVRHAFNEGDRLGVTIGMHACDGFATAGGPWITPELSMQKVVWTETYVNGGRRFQDTLSKPEAYKGYYRDIAVFAFPTPNGADQSSYTVVPKVTTSKPDEDVQFLTVKGNKKSFRSEDPCWIQYAFEQPITCHSITIKTEGRNYFANRMQVEVSDDGQHFRSIGQLQPP
ncbi:MAG: DNA-binding protein, partial [Flavisolibacter sp.]|nr:DNA-binding protein [Flavisolibacter sp.]